MAAHVGWDLVQVGGGRVDERPYAGPRVDTVDEDAHPVGVAPCGVLIALPIEHEDRCADVGADGVDEVVGFGGRVAAAR